MTLPPADTVLLGHIADRAVILAHQCGTEVPRVVILLDMAIAHVNCPIDLERLLHAPDQDFAHDVFGVMANLNRATGRLGCFLPRTARMQ